MLSKIILLLGVVFAFCGSSEGCATLSVPITVFSEDGLNIAWVEQIGYSGCANAGLSSNVNKDQFNIKVATFDNNGNVGDSQEIVLNVPGKVQRLFYQAVYGYVLVQYYVYADQVLPNVITTLYRIDNNGLEYKIESKPFNVARCNSQTIDVPQSSIDSDGCDFANYDFYTVVPSPTGDFLAIASTVGSKDKISLKVLSSCDFAVIVDIREDVFSSAIFNYDNFVKWTDLKIVSMIDRSGSKQKTLDISLTSRGWTKPYVPTCKTGASTYSTERSILGETIQFDANIGLASPFFISLQIAQNPIDLSNYGAFKLGRTKYGLISWNCVTSKATKRSNSVRPNYNCDCSSYDGTENGLKDTCIVSIAFNKDASAAGSPNVSGTTSNNGQLSGTGIGLIVGGAVICLVAVVAVSVLVMKRLRKSGQAGLNIGTEARV